MEKEKPSTSLLSQWKNRAKKVEHNTIEKMPEGKIAPLSSGQQRLWFMQKLLPDNPVYNYSESLIFNGKLNEKALRKSLELVFERHNILRSTYHFDDGKIFQRLNEETQIGLNVFDLSNFPQTEKEDRKLNIMLDDAGHEFNLEQYPLVRLTLIKLEETVHIFLVTMHHIIFDKWSMDLFLEQLAAHYRAVLVGGAVSQGKYKGLQFSDYAYWQEKRDLNQSHLDYWTKKLGGNIPHLDLPIDFPLPLQTSYKGNTNLGKFSPDLSKRILDLSKEMGTTPYVLLLSAYYLLLYRYSGQEDILIGSPISQRTDKSMENIIGFFDETIVLRTSVSGSMSFVDLVKLVRTTTLEAFSNMDVPFDVLVKKLKPDRSLSLNPFFRVMFIYHSVNEIPSFGPDLELTHDFFNPGVSKFDLTLYISNDRGLLSTVFEYNTDIFKESTIIQFQEHLGLILEGVTSHPNTQLDKVPMLTSREKKLFQQNQVDNDGPFTNFKGIHEIIAQRCVENSTARAVTFEKETITYGELLNRSTKLVPSILEHTKGENEIVGLCVDRSIEMIVGMLAILKAGCAYLPLDPDYPVQRIDYMLQDSRVKLILTGSRLKSTFAAFEDKLILIDAERLQSQKNRDISIFPESKEDDLAYVIYTSGSSGKPKGVPIRHRNIINSTEGRLSYYDDSPSVFLLMSSIAFDSSKAGIFWTLCTGGTLVIAPKHIEQDLDRLAGIIEYNKVSHTLMLPSLYNLLLEHSDKNQLLSLTTTIVAGEACSPETGKKHFETLRSTSLYNEYGPTEATVWCLAHKVTQDDTNRVIPIGKPVANSEIYLLDKNLSLVPYGARGEIYIGGAGLSDGYLNRPDLTENAYINNPFSGVPGEKLYKTGDLGRYGPSGDIEFLGRADQQVKIRGRRIELDGVESAIGQNEMVDRCAVVVEESSEPLSFDNDSSEIMAYFDEHLSVEEAEQLLESIESLKREEKNFLLRKMP